MTIDFNEKASCQWEFNRWEKAMTARKEDTKPLDQKLIYLFAASVRFKSQHLAELNTEH